MSQWPSATAHTLLDCPGQYEQDSSHAATASPSFHNEQTPETNGSPDSQPPSAETSQSSTVAPEIQCSCVTCLQIGSVRHPMAKNPLVSMSLKEFFYSDRLLCRVPDCSIFEFGDVNIIAHEKSHFLNDGEFRCKEDRCSFVTKRWADFKRHSGSKHCTNPKKRFPCPLPWCKYSGNNGFARKDKLNSHYKAVHGKKTTPGKPYKVIKPKLNDTT